MKQRLRVLVVADFPPLSGVLTAQRLHELQASSHQEMVLTNLQDLLPSERLGPAFTERLRHFDSIFLDSTACASLNDLERLLQALGKQPPPVVVHIASAPFDLHRLRLVLEKFTVAAAFVGLPEAALQKALPIEGSSSPRAFPAPSVLIAASSLTPPSLLEWKSRSVDLRFLGERPDPLRGQLGVARPALGERLARWQNSLGLVVDAERHLFDRFADHDRLDALANSRALVAAPAGSRCFDLEGGRAGKVTAWLQEHPPTESATATGLQPVLDEILADAEGALQGGGFGRLHAEAALTHTPLLLVPGDYSDILRPEEHYLALKPDLSNLEECWARLSDDGFRTTLTEAAHERVIEAQEFRIPHFAGQLDECFDQLLASGFPVRIPSETTRLKVLQLCPHAMHLDPRIDWWRRSTSDKIDVLTLEIEADRLQPESRHGEEGRVITLPGAGQALSDLPAIFWQVPRIQPVLKELAWIDALVAHEKIAQGLAGGPDYTHSWLLAFVARCSASFMLAGASIQGADCVMAVDLPSLPAGIALAALHRVPLIYDAQEVWSHSNPEFSGPAIRFWEDLEARLARQVDHLVTVSPGIAEWYRAATGQPVVVAPNFSPLTTPRPPAPTPGSAPVRFGFLGNFAPNRGLEDLVHAWDLPPEVATLDLQGPPSATKTSCRQIAEARNLPPGSIRFPEPVSESELIQAAGKFQVGLVPYLYRYPYSHCSPNKFSQYCAAGTAILGHELPFVSALIREHECGWTANFRDRADLQRVFAAIAATPKEIFTKREQAYAAAAAGVSWVQAVAPTRAWLEAQVPARRGFEEWDLSEATRPGSGGLLSAMRQGSRLVGRKARSGLRRILSP